MNKTWLILIYFTLLVPSFGSRFSWPHLTSVLSSASSSFFSSSLQFTKESQHYDANDIYTSYLIKSILFSLGQTDHELRREQEWREISSLSLESHAARKGMTERRWESTKKVEGIERPVIELKRSVHMGAKALRVLPTSSSPPPPTFQILPFIARSVGLGMGVQGGNRQDFNVLRRYSKCSVDK